MTIPTEREIMDCLTENLRGAADDCRFLAVLPAQGPTYARLRERLVLITGACRSIAWIRDDAGGVGAPLGMAGTHGLEGLAMGRADPMGWLEAAHMMGTLHERIGSWVRGHYPRPLFMQAAKVLGEFLRQLERRRDMPLERSTMTQGALMPPLRPAPHRDTKPVHVSRSSGLLL